MGKKADPDTPADEILGPVELLEARARMYADEAALALGPEVLSYGTWLEKALNTAMRFEGRGVRPDDVVLLRFSLESFLDYAVAYIATLAVGAVAVPLAQGLPDDASTRVATACQASWLAAPAADGSGTVIIGRTGPPAELAQGIDTAAVRRRCATDIAEILFTSGSTGDPQGVACPYGEIGFAYDLTPPVDLAVPARGVDLHAAAFGTNFCQEMLRSPLNWGSMVVTLPDFGAQTLRAAVQRYGVETLRLTPVMARMLARLGPTDAAWLSGIREISVSSAYCPPEVLGRLQQAAPNAKIVNQYSLTESGRAKIKNVWGTDPADSLGRPVEGSEVRIVDERGTCAVNQVGEIQIRHVEAISRAYLPASGDAAPHAGDKADWISTGDIGYVDGDGYVYLVDRAKDIINVGGRKVSPLAVERVLGQESAVADVAVVGVPHETLGEVVAAMVVLADGYAVLPDIPLEWTLQPHEIPKIYVTSDHIPLNAAGKVSRDQVRTAITTRARPQDYTQRGPDDDDLAEVFRAICSHLLERQIHGLGGNWFTEGGDSLTAVELLATLEDRFGIEMDEGLFFGEHTLHDILDALRLRVSKL
ncbi:MAG: AMP-binding protein [Catenulispora sp.]|nr:AMP-binding protein [Catenulispora sp.]